MQTRFSQRSVHGAMSTVLRAALELMRMPSPRPRGTGKAVQIVVRGSVVRGLGGETLKIPCGDKMLRQSSPKCGAPLSSMGKRAELACSLWTERWTMDQRDNQPCQSPLSREGVVLGCWHAFNILQHSLIYFPPHPSLKQNIHHTS